MKVLGWSSLVDLLILVLPLQLSKLVWINEGLLETWPDLGQVPGHSIR